MRSPRVLKKLNVSSSIATTEMFWGVGSVPRMAEPNVDAVQLEAAKEVRPEADEPKTGGRKSDAEKQRHLQAAPSRAVHHHAL